MGLLLLFTWSRNGHNSVERVGKTISSDQIYLGNDGKRRVWRAFDVKFFFIADGTSAHSVAVLARNAKLLTSTIFGHGTRMIYV